MGLLEDLDAAEAPKVHGCKFCDVLAALPPDERERIAASTLGPEPLATFLTNHGFPVSHHPIKRHRAQGHVTP